MNDLITAADAARECLENSIRLANMARRATSDTAQDAIALGQLYALIAIAAELSRIADGVEITNGRVF